MVPNALHSRVPLSTLDSIRRDIDRDHAGGTTAIFRDAESLGHVGENKSAATNADCAAVAFRMLDQAMAKPSPEVERDRREKLEADFPSNRYTEFDRDPRDEARDSSECGGGR